MKKILLLSLLFAWTGVVFAANVKKVAILEVVDKEKKMEYGHKLIVRSNLTRAITNTEGYDAFERADIDAIMAEHDFQRTGNVSNKDIKKIGEMTGAAYVLVAEGVMMDGGIYLTAKILNVETTKVEVTDNVTIKDTRSVTIQNGCRTLAANMFGALAGTSTTINKLFAGLFTKSPEQARLDSIEAAQKANRARIEAQMKEEQRMAEDRAREERRIAEAQARQEREEADARAREERRLAEEKARQEREEAEERVREERRIAGEQAALVQAERQKYYITKLSGNEYEYMGSVMDKKAYENFLQNNCPAAYSQYIKGKKLAGAGWGLFGAGVGLGFVGSVSMLGCALFDLGDVFYILGIGGMVSGSILTVTSIPLLCVGYAKQGKSHEVYNERCASSSAQYLSLNLTSGQNGLGIALNF